MIFTIKSFTAGLSHQVRKLRAKHLTPKQSYDSWFTIHLCNNCKDTLKSEQRKLECCPYCGITPPPKGALSTNMLVIRKARLRDLLGNIIPPYFEEKASNGIKKIDLGSDAYRKAIESRFPVK